MKELKPKCLNKKEPALTAHGHFVPCCWCDVHFEYFQEKGFFEDHLHIANTSDIITDVFLSKPWKDFFAMLQTDSESAPNVCQEHCKLNDKTYEKIHHESI